MEIQKSLNIIKSLADNSRLMVINSLLEKPQYVEELAERLNLAASTVSFHLKKLENANLVTKKKDQYYVMYSVNPEVLDLQVRELISFKNFDKYLQEERMEAYRQKVIHTFFPNGKMERLPAQWKKKLIVLDTFKDRFESNRKYTEKEVDELIKTDCNDHCAIRRMLVDTRYLARENGIYWVIDDSSEDASGSPETPPNEGQKVW